MYCGSGWGHTQSIREGVRVGEVMMGGEGGRQAVSPRGGQQKKILDCRIVGTRTRNSLVLSIPNQVWKED